MVANTKGRTSFDSSRLKNTFNRVSLLFFTWHWKIDVYWQPQACWKQSNFYHFMLPSLNNLPLEWANWFEAGEKDIEIYSFPWWELYCFPSTQPGSNPAWATGTFKVVIWFYLALFSSLARVTTRKSHCEASASPAGPGAAQEAVSRTMMKGSSKRVIGLMSWWTTAVPYL